jgi:hypothetical protein
MATQPARRRGRPQLDLAVRLRNWGWYWMVRAESQLSDDALDARYVQVQNIERPRLFFRIRSVGSSPDELRGYHSRRSIYELVHEDDEFPEARQWFESPIWRFLSDRSLGPSDFSEFIQSQLRRRGLFRAAPADIFPGRAVLGKDEPAFEAGPSAHYRSMLRLLAADGDINSLAFLSALYREAHDAFESDMVTMLEEVLEGALERFVENLLLPSRYKRCFSQLVVDRILRNRWIREADMPTTADYLAMPRPKQIREFLSWYVSIKSESLRLSSARLPIVWNTERVMWYRSRRAEILDIVENAPAVDWDAAAAAEDLRNDSMDSQKNLAEAEESFDRALHCIKVEFDAQEDIKKRLQGLGDAPARPEKDGPIRILVEDLSVFGTSKSK